MRALATQGWRYLRWTAVAAFLALPAAAVAPPPEAMGAPASSLERASRPTGPAVGGRPWLQPLIDATPAGGTLKLPPGEYAGPVLLAKPLTLDGGGRATVTNGGVGTVFTLEASHAVLRGLTFTGSGDSHNTDDACLNVRGDDNTVADNDFLDCLFGIDLKQSNRNQITHNRIRSKPLDLGARGDALRLWYSMDNRIENNAITDARDVVVWYSDGNLLRGNTGRRSRYAVHFMYATRNVVEDNDFSDNSVGIYVMYTEGVVLRHNRVVRSVGAAGMGIGFKEASNTVVEGNDIIGCGIGLSSDLSPFQPDSTVTIAGNHLAYNGVGLAFTGNQPGTLVEGNHFEGNLEPVAQSGGQSAMHVTWRGNFWDDYQGFDVNHDGIGDTPFELYAFTDSIWMETPAARFFKGTPVMEALDFLERLAPFSAPLLLLRDETPRFDRPAEVAR